MLRKLSIDGLDTDNLLIEMDSIAGDKRAQLVKQLRTLLVHLLKWAYQPSHRGASWESTIKVQRSDISYLIAKNPSLKSYLAEALKESYRKAPTIAAVETGLPQGVFPQELSWSFDQITAEDFWPGSEAPHYLERGSARKLKKKPKRNAP